MERIKIIILAAAKVLSLVACGDSAQMIVGNTFMQRNGDTAKDSWNCGGSGSGPKGAIGFSVEGNNTKWLLRVAGGFDLVSEYFPDEA